MPALLRRPFLVVFGLIAIATLIATVINVRSDGAEMRYEKGEVHVYDMAARRMVEGEEISRPDDFKPFTYPPFFAVPFVHVFSENGALRSYSQHPPAARITLSWMSQSAQS